ncbi:hypothetical protein C8J57DRAFT_1465791 [Mycena rebaudengoi]|nr:hypothetical protein C8J57DRAFT_1465791 [Mycena rebaudengoi]
MAARFAALSSSAHIKQWQPQTMHFSLPATILVATPPLVAHRHRAFAHHLGGQHKPEARGTRQAAKEARGVCKPRRTISGVSASPGRIGARAMRLASPGQGREVPAMAGAPLRERKSERLAEFKQHGGGQRGVEHGITSQEFGNGTRSRGGVCEVMREGKGEGGGEMRRELPGGYRSTEV